LHFLLLPPHTIQYYFLSFPFLISAALFQGQGELDQIDKIFKMLGVPTDETWTNFSALPHCSNGNLKWKPNKTKGSRLREEFPAQNFGSQGSQTAISKEGFDLLEKLLMMDPKKRMDASRAEKHEYFSSDVGVKESDVEWNFPKES
jgi:cell division cycle 2-like protein